MNAERKRVPQAGVSYAVGGAIWFLTIIGSVLVGFPWSEPHTTSFSIAEAIFIVAQTLLLTGFFGIYPSIFMFPFAAITGETLDIAIGFWGLVRLALRLASRAQVAEPVVVVWETVR